MPRLISVRPLTTTERQALQAGLRSPDAFVLRRCQILLASARGDRVPHIAHALSCHAQTVRSAIMNFNRHGLAVLSPGRKVPHTIYPAFAPHHVEQLCALLQRDPRDFGKDSRAWTLKLAADVCFEQGLTSTRVTGETVRATLARLGIRFQEAKQWSRSHDTKCAKKTARTNTPI